MEQRTDLIEAKNAARIKFHDRRELETNEHDFAFMDGFDVGADFALSLNPWTEIKSADDLPRDGWWWITYTTPGGGEHVRKARSDPFHEGHWHAKDDPFQIPDGWIIAVMPYNEPKAFAPPTPVQGGE